MITRDVFDYFAAKLGFDEVIARKDVIALMDSLSSYLSHSRTGKTAGRTFATVRKNLDDLYFFLNCIGCSEKEIIKIITEAPDMLNVEVDKLYRKYIILGVLEDCKNDENFRKKMILKKPRDFRTSLEMVYARYDFAVSVGFPIENISWSMLLHDSNREFAKKFVISAYFKPYRIFESIEECSPEMLLEKFPIDDNVIENLKDLEVNKEVVMQFEKRTLEEVPAV